MSEEKKNLTLSTKLELKKTFDAGKIKQSFSHGRSRSVSVEVKKKRSFGPKSPNLEKAFKESKENSESKDHINEIISERDKPSEKEEFFDEKNPTLDAKKEKETIENKTQKKEFVKEQQTKNVFKDTKEVRKDLSNSIQEQKKTNIQSEEKAAKLKSLKLIKVPKKQEERRKGKLTISEALDDNNNERVRSLAAIKRAREKAKLRLTQNIETNIQVKEKKKREVVIPDFIAVNELGTRLAEKTSDLIKVLMKLGVMATINQTIDGDTAELVVIELGHTPKRVSEADVEIGLSGNLDEEKQLNPRSPVVTIMGHVDHGKTSLLDVIREKKVTQTEAGGITQHIGAYMIDTPKGKITFLDTPGHAAFTQMRARGSNVTDIVILVVAADDSVNDQTIEAISHAKASKCPIIVAINKIDLPAANPQKVESDLLSHEIVSEKMGGDTVLIEVSAKNKIGIDDLIDAILLQSEILELKANSKRNAEGTVIESKIEKGRGPVISVLVQKGTLRVGDIVIAGKEWGKVRALTDDENKRLNEAFPSFPVEIIGLSGAPEAGDEFVVVESEARAREVTQYRGRIKRVRDNASLKRTSVEQMITDASEDVSQEFPIIIKADVHGSKEAIEQSLLKLDVGNVKIEIVHTGVGEINESDVTLAIATKAIILGFNVRTNVQARNLAKRDGVIVNYYSIIYEVIDEVTKLMRGKLDPEYDEKIIGKLEIKKIFKVSKSDNIAGCIVLDGYITNNAKVRVIRNEEVVHQTEISSLRREKNEIKEVKAGQECGIGFLNYSDFEENDILECFILQAKQDT